MGHSGFKISEHAVEQRSDAWMSLRVGRLTCSRLKDIMPTPKQRTDWTDKQLGVLREVAAERLTSEREESYTSAAMQWGIEQEASAMHLYQSQYFEDIRPVGFFSIDEWVGGSPDGIVMRDGEDWATWETKSPTSKQHLLYLLDGDELWNAYKYQVLGQCLVTGLNRYVLCSYDPRFPEDKQLTCVEGELSDGELSPLTERLEAAIEIIKGWIE